MGRCIIVEGGELTRTRKCASITDTPSTTERDEMLQHHNIPIKLIEHAFLVAVEAEEGCPTHEQIELKLADSLTWVEGTGRIDIQYLGEMDIGEDVS